MARKRRRLYYNLAWWALAGLIGFAFAAAVLPRGEGAKGLVPRPTPILESPEVMEEDPLTDEPGGYVDTESMIRGYLGIHGTNIAIYHGKPPHGELEYITEYEVRDDVREQLEAGVPFNDTEELLRLLENFTS
ncbi:MAG: BofC C-terminal domain-containing protein [Bacillota bacterium]|nr:BofC C-terminal domain-containing protein [Bacillota bacterium]MDW7683264.1 BofC C-terminal domain-containing protein [Bacillota bacterium]